MAPNVDVRSRRQILMDGLGVAGAALIAILGGAPRARAADGDFIMIGGENGATGPTGLANGSNGNVVFRTESYQSGGSGSGSGTALMGTSRTGTGVAGFSDGGEGVHGESATKTGVLGYSGASFLLPRDDTGVFGYANQNASANGVVGASSVGTGVNGQSDSGQGVIGSSTNGIGVYATSSFGVALGVQGRFSLSQAGAATVKGGKSSVKVLLDETQVLATASFVLATLQQHRAGVFVVATVKDLPGHSLTIYLSKAVSLDTRVGWVILN